MAMIFILSVLLFPCAAHAGCDTPSQHILAAEHEILAFEQVAAHQELKAAMGAMACSPPATPVDLGRFWLATAVLAHIEGEEVMSREAFAAAARVAPPLWVADYGDDMARLRRQAVGALASRPRGKLVLSAEPQHGTIWLDGQVVAPPLTLDAGLHFIQLEVDGMPYFQRGFIQPPGEDLSLRVDTPEPPSRLSSAIGQGGAPSPDQEADTLGSEGGLSGSGATEIPPPAQVPGDIVARSARLRRQASLHWMEIEQGTRVGPDEAPRSSRLGVKWTLKRYIRRYEDTSVRSHGETYPVDIAQVGEARRRLVALSELPKTSPVRSAIVDKSIRFTGVGLDLAASALSAPQVDTGSYLRAEMLGLGSFGALNTELHLRGKLGLKAGLGWLDSRTLSGQDTWGELEMSNHVASVHPSIVAAQGSLSLTLTFEHVQLSAGPLYTLGILSTSGTSTDGSSAMKGALKGPIYGPGGVASACYHFNLPGPFELGPQLTAAAFSDGDGPYTWVSAGLSFGYARR